MFSRSYSKVSRLKIKDRIILLLLFFAFTSKNAGCQEYVYHRPGTNTNVQEATQFLREYDREATGMCYRVTMAQWKFVTNITEATRRRMLEELTLSSKFERLSWRKAAAFDWRRLSDQSARRQLQKIVTQSRASLPDDKFSEIQQLISEMKEIYNSAKICPFGQKPFDPHVPNYRSQMSPANDQNRPYDAQSRQYDTQSRPYDAQSRPYDAQSRPYDAQSRPYDAQSRSYDAQSRPYDAQSRPYESQNRYGRDKIYVPTANGYDPNYLINSQENTNTPNYCDMQLDPEISRILAHSRIESELLYVWKSFRDTTGPRLKNNFMRYVQLANQAAVASGYSDAGEQMRANYEDPSFRESLQEIYNQIQPLYKQLFTYVRRKLIQRYGEGVVRPDGPIPGHLLGNMWAQNWKSIMDLVIPYPQSPNVDVTSEMLRQGFTPLRMFQVAEEFYTSLGLKAMPPEFWRGSMLARPSDRSVQCTASAWDFCNRIDYRIKQCTEVTQQDLVSTHHEMAHIQYYLEYADQPQLFRDGASPAFHEAVANAATLSVYNVPHLQRIGLYHNRTNDQYEVSMNFLMSMALEKLVYLPFAYTVDQWRWSVFQDGVQNMNSRWWEMKLRYQGVVPPVPRRESDFDPGSKYHIISDQEYVKYFLATVLEFQIFEQLCVASGQTTQLHECDIYRSRDAGRLLSELMQQGSSKPASEIIRTVLTRGKTNRVSPESLVRYFRPLELWLRVQNRDEPIIGWNSNFQDLTLFAPQRATGNTNTLTPAVIMTSVILMFIGYFVV